MTEPHPSETDLFRFAFEANALRLAASPLTNASHECLDDESIAAFVEGSIDSADRADVLAHLVACGRCRHEVASLALLLEAPGVKREIDRLNRVSRKPHRGRLISGVVIASALAAGLVFMLVPASSSKVADPRYREESVTGTVAPRLVAPLTFVSPLEAFRWTSVPRADRYRITVFDRDGTVVWEAQTRDTTIMLTELVRRTSKDIILWRVEAHVGWEDRWASSDLAMLTVRRASR